MPGAQQLPHLSDCAPVALMKLDFWLTHAELTVPPSARRILKLSTAAMTFFSRSTSRELGENALLTVSVCLCASRHFREATQEIMIMPFILRPRPGMRASENSREMS